MEVNDREIRIVLWRIMKVFLVASFVFSMVLILYIKNAPSKEERLAIEKRWKMISQQADSLFIPVEFTGVVSKAYKVKCGGVKDWCKKVIFLRKSPDYLDTMTIDYGFIQLYPPNYNVFLVSTRYRLSDDPPESIDMPIEPGDSIKKEKGNANLLVYSKRYNKTFQIKLMYQIEGESDVNRAWEKKMFKF